jgi:hypothetical protein
MKLGAQPIQVSDQLTAERPGLRRDSGVSAQDVGDDALVLSGRGKMVIDCRFQRSAVD